VARKKKVPIEKFAEAVKEILDETQVKTFAGMKIAMEKIGNEGAKLVKGYAASDFNYRHKSKPAYRASWNAKITKETNIDIETTIYSKVYQLPHLLEYSHSAGRYGGGSYAGRPHIKKAEDEIQKLVGEKVRAEIYKKLGD